MIGFLILHVKSDIQAYNACNDELAIHKSQTLHIDDRSEMESRIMVSKEEQLKNALVKILNKPLNIHRRMKSNEIKRK